MMTLKKIWAWIKKFFVYNAKDLAGCCDDPEDCKQGECIDPKLIKGTKKYYYASRRKKQPKKEKQALKVKKSKRVIKHIVVHCSATKEGMDFSAEDIDRWHKNRGWRGIGYNWVIRNDARGTIETGRDVDRIPAHVKGINRNSLGICYIGGLDQNGDPKDTRTDIQKHQLRSLLKDLKKIYPEAEISGHNQWSSKACPCYDCKIEYSQI